MKVGKDSAKTRPVRMIRGGGRRTAKRPKREEVSPLGKKKKHKNNRGEEE